MAQPMNTRQSYDFDGNVTGITPLGPFDQVWPVFSDTYFKSPNTSLKKTWLEHKGVKVYLTTTARTKELWNPSGDDNLVIKYTQLNNFQKVDQWMPISELYQRNLQNVLLMNIEQQRGRFNDELKYDQNELLTLAHAAANEATFDLGTFIGELPETLQFLGAIVLKLINIFKAIKTGKIFKDSEKYFRKGYVKRLADDSTDAWLAYRYAIMPLIYSLQDGLEALELPESEFIRTRKRDSFESKIELNLRGMPQEVPVGTLSGYQEVIARAQVYTILTEAQAAKRRLLIGPFTTAWELVPLSFVVDWVFQVGDFIASFRNLPHESQGTTYSVSTEEQYVAYVDSQVFENRSGGAQLLYVTSGTQSLGYTRKDYQRTVVPSFKHEIPVGVQLNTCRIIDAFSLSFKIGQSFINRRH